MLSPRQAQLLDNATRFPKMEKFRFIATIGSINHQTCEQLAFLGYFRLTQDEHLAQQWKEQGKVQYDVTLKGKLAILKHHKGLP